MTLSPFLGLFWFVLSMALIAAALTRNQGLITAALLLVAHQGLGVIYMITLQSKTIYEIYGILCFAFFALSAYVCLGSNQRWKILFSAGFIAMLGVNWVGAVLNTQSLIPVWVDTFILYGMMGIIFWRWSRERGTQLDRPPIAGRAFVRSGLVAPRSNGL